MLLLSALEFFLTWAFVAFVLIGIGCVVLALFAKDHSLHDAFWTGLSVSVAVLEIWNLVFPVTASITLVLFALGILGLALNRSLVLSRLLTAWQNSRSLFPLGAALALLLAFRHVDLLAVRRDDGPSDRLAGRRVDVLAPVDR